MQPDGSTACETVFHPTGSGPAGWGTTDQGLRIGTSVPHSSVRMPRPRYPAVSWPMRQGRESEVQVLDADGSRFGELESGAFEQRYDLLESHVTASVPEMRRKVSFLRLGLAEVNQEHPALGLDDPSQLGRKLPTGNSSTEH